LRAVDVSQDEEKFKEYYLLSLCVRE